MTEAVLQSASFMSVAFGRFTLIDLRGERMGEVVIAPECVLLQRGPAAPVRDVSYLALWSPTRVDAIARELAALPPSAVVDAKTPELHAILHAIAPATTPVFVAAGECRGGFTRRRLKAVLARQVDRRQPSV